MWQWIVSPGKAPDQAEELEIGFEAGAPVSVKGAKLGPVDLLNKLNEIATKMVPGGTAPESVRAAIAILQSKISSLGAKP